MFFDTIFMIHPDSITIKTIIILSRNIIKIIFTELYWTINTLNSIFDIILITPYRNVKLLQTLLQ